MSVSDGENQRSRVHLQIVTHKTVSMVEYPCVIFLVVLLSKQQIVAIWIIGCALLSWRHPQLTTVTHHPPHTSPTLYYHYSLVIKRRKIIHAVSLDVRVGWHLRRVFFICCVFLDVCLRAVCHHDNHAIIFTMITASKDT